MREYFESWKALTLRSSTWIFTENCFPKHLKCLEEKWTVIFAINVALKQGLSIPMTWWCAWCARKLIEECHVAGKSMKFSQGKSWLCLVKIASPHKTISRVCLGFAGYALVLQTFRFLCSCPRFVCRMLICNIFPKTWHDLPPTAKLTWTCRWQCNQQKRQNTNKQ